MREILKKCLWIFVLTMILLSVFTPQIIELVYPKVGCRFTITSFKKEELLSFYGSFLAFIGTICLGTISLRQNNKLSDINNDLVKQQYKPVITINPLVDLKDDKEKHRTYYRKVQKNKNDIMIDNGYSSKPQGHMDCMLNIKNIGLGPVLCVELFWYKLDNVKGLDSLNEILTKNIDGFYDKLTYSNFQYIDEDKLKNDSWLLFTEFDLGISEETNSLNLIFSFEDRMESLHSIIEIRYENLLGTKYKRLIYLGYEDRVYILPISKEYIV